MLLDELCGKDISCPCVLANEARHPTKGLLPKKLWGRFRVPIV